MSSQTSSSKATEDSKRVRNPRRCLMDALVTHHCCCQTSGQRHASKMPRYFLIFVALATAFSVYLVSPPFSVSAHKTTEL